MRKCIVSVESQLAYLVLLLPALLRTAAAAQEAAVKHAQGSA